MNLLASSPDGDTVAKYVSDAGMVCRSLIHHDEELLDLGKGLDAYAQRGATMGIPLLYPWANRLDGAGYQAAGQTVRLPADRTLIPVDPNGLPIHGVVPGRMRWWPQERVDEATVTALLEWTSEDLLEVFPFPHEVCIEATATSGALTVITTVRAVADNPVPISFGYHPYLRLPASHRDSWHIEMPALEHLVLDGQQIPTGARAPLKQRAFDLAGTSWDDAFATAAQPVRFTVSRPGRGIAVEFLEGYRYAQIYAPPEHDFVCFEPMTAPTNALVSGEDLTVISPGEQYRAAFRIVVWRD